MKDFAVYFNIEKWLKSTADMDADVRGWYINLLLHEYDKDGLPNDVEKIAQLAGVRFSEYARFEHVFEHVLKHKFEQCPDGKRRNPYMSQVVVERQTFKAKREMAAKFSVILRAFRKLYPGQGKYEPVLKKLITEDIDTNDKHVLEHLFKQVFEHPLDISIDIDINNSSSNVLPQTETHETTPTAQTESTATTGQTIAETETEKSTRKKFVPPEVHEVAAYMAEISYPGFVQQEAERFVNWYTGNGWQVGKSKMKDWQATVRNWKIRQNEQQSTVTGGKQSSGGASKHGHSNEELFAAVARHHGLGGMPKDG